MAEQDYQALVTEVLELGEQLFELTLVGQTTPGPTASDTTTEDDLAEPAPDQDQEDTASELRITADEFFSALRLLFGLTQP